LASFLLSPEERRTEAVAPEDVAPDAGRTEGVSPEEVVVVESPEGGRTGGGGPRGRYRGGVPG
jgi:hypothetical protein